MYCTGWKGINQNVQVYMRLVLSTELNNHMAFDAVAQN